MIIFTGKNAQHEHSKGLNLSHDEVAHIRSVLAKAKLEALPLTQELRSDLERSRVCFQCMKVKFSLFSWAYACKLCRHSICSKCITKVMNRLIIYNANGIYLVLN